MKTLPLGVTFRWSPGAGIENEYNASVDRDGALVIEDVAGEFRAWGHWQPESSTITIERVSWVPSKRHPQRLELPALVRAAADAIARE